MSDIDDKIRLLRSRIEATVRMRAGLEHDRETATARADAVLAQLREEFDVDTAEDARIQLAALRTCLDHTLDELVDALNAIEV